MTVDEIKAAAEKRAKNATNQQLVDMYRKAAQSYQSKVEGNCSNDALEKAFEGAWTYRNELLKRLG